MFKKGAVEVITPTIKKVSKQIIKQAGEESLEEALTMFLVLILLYLQQNKARTYGTRKTAKNLLLH
jgi:hypothetical protein